MYKIIHNLLILDFYKQFSYNFIKYNFNNFYKIYYSFLIIFLTFSKLSKNLMLIWFSVTFHIILTLSLIRTFLLRCPLYINKFFHIIIIIYLSTTSSCRIKQLDIRLIFKQFFNIHKLFLIFQSKNLFRVKYL